MCIQARGQARVFFNIASLTQCFEAWSLTDAGAHLLAILAARLVSGILLSPGIKGEQNSPRSSHGCWESKLGSLRLHSKQLHMEPSPGHSEKWYQLQIDREYQFHGLEDLKCRCNRNFLKIPTALVFVPAIVFLSKT